MIEVPTYNPAMPREENHEQCQRQGHINSFVTGANVSGHDFVECDDGVLVCRVCGYVSR